MENIRNVNTKIIECTFEDAHVEYMILITFEEKGFFYGWNKKSFFLEKEKGEYIDTYETFGDAYDRQNTSSAFSTRFFKCKSIDLCEKEISLFFKHLETKEIEEKSRKIKNIKFLS